MIAAYLDARELSLSQGERSCKHRKIVHFGGFKLLWFGLDNFFQLIAYFGKTLVKMNAFFFG